MQTALAKVEVPAQPSDDDWLAWVELHYPYDERFDKWLRYRRSEPIEFTPDMLEDLRGIVVRKTAASLASLWFWMRDNQDEASKLHALERRHATEREKARLVILARTALSGNLGKNRKQRDAAKATALEFIGRDDPAKSSLDDLQDWHKMQEYSRAILAGYHAKRPVLNRDRLKRQQFNDAVDEIDAGIGSIRFTPDTQQVMFEEGSET